jgi:hypothetical protein
MSDSETPRLTEVQIKDLQEKLQPLVDEMRKSPQYAQYVNNRCLGILDGRMVMIDQLMVLGILH